MKKIKTIVVDDEKAAREGVAIMAQEIPDLKVIAICKNGIEAIMAIKEHKPDLLLLDIEMPDVNGFEVLNSLDMEQMPEVIFITAYDHYSIKAFEVHAVDYLLKPFTDARFYEAIEQAKRRINTRSLHEANEKLKSLLKQHQIVNTDTSPQELINDGTKMSGRLVIKSEGKIHFVPHSSIIWVEAYDYYIKVHTEKEFYLVRESMKQIEGTLPQNQFVRIHKSSIINLECLRQFIPSAKGDYVHLGNGKQLRVSRGYRQNLLKFVDS